MQRLLSGRVSLSSGTGFKLIAGQEVITGRIELKQHEPHLVHRMLQHLYMVDYSASEIETDGKKEESFVSELHTHVMMYAMGDEYDIKDLKEEALWKFNKAVEAKQEQSDEPTSVLEVVPAIYTTTPDSDRGLRDAVVAWGAKRLGWIHDLADFKSAVTQVPTYMLEVLPTFLKRLEDDRRRYIGECWTCDIVVEDWSFDGVYCHGCGEHKPLLLSEMVDAS